MSKVLLLIAILFIATAYCFGYERGVKFAREDAEVERALSELRAEVE